MATVPGAPIVQPRPLALSQELQFFWAAPSSDGGSAITSYVIFDGTTSNALSSDSRWYRATGLVNGTVYQYRVAASNAIGLGNYSFFRAVQPGNRPAVPTNVSATNVDGLRYQISWNNPSDTGQASLQRGFIQAFPLDDSGRTLSTSTYSSFIVSRSVWGGNASDSNSRILELFSNYNYKVLVRVMNDPGFSLPITYTSTIYINIFTPDYVSSLRLWLDATNSSNFTLSSSYISTWTDKSANAYAVSQTTQSNFPSFSTNFVTFSSFQFLNLPQAAINNCSTWTMFFYFVPKDTYAWITAKQHDASNTYNLISYATTTNSSGTVTNSLSTTMYLHTSNAGSTINYPTGFSTNSINLIRFQYDAQSNLTLWNNGFLWSTITGNFRLADVTNATNATLGALVQSNEFRNPSTSLFQLGSMLFYSSIITGSNAYKLEGYLSFMYGLQSNLPVNHPYYAQPPTLTDTQLNFSPSSISSLELWLDAADATTISTTGTASSVVQWFDKSGKARDAVRYQGNPFYSSTALTGNLPGIVFLQASTLRVPVPTNTFRSSIHAFVVFQKTAATNTFEGLVSRGVNNFPGPFDVYSNSRLWGNGVAYSSFNGSFNFNAATSVNNWSFKVTSNIAQEYWQGSTVDQRVSSTQYGDVASSIFLGTRQDFGTTFRGIISETLFYSSTLTFGERQAIEGYLAWKWRIQSTLIINHPFRFQPPTIRSLYEGSNGAFVFQRTNTLSTLISVSDADIFLGSSNFTIEWWQNIPGNNVYSFGFANALNMSFQNFVNYCTFQINTNTFSINFSTPTFINSMFNQWQHIALVKSNNVMRCFFNGMVSPQSTTAVSTINSSLNFHIVTSPRVNQLLGDFHIVKNRVLYFDSNFSPPSSIQSNVSTILLLKPTNLGRCMIDKGPRNKTIFNFEPMGWTPNSYPDFVTSFGSLLNVGQSSNSYVQTGMDNDLRLRTGDFTIEFYANITNCNANPWSLGRSINTIYLLNTLGFNNNELSWRVITSSFAQTWTLLKSPMFTLNHYALTRSNSTIRAFQNGIQLSGTVTSAYDFNPTTEIWYIGNTSNTASPGYMTNFHIVKGVALYTSSFINPTIPIQSNASTVLLCLFISSNTITTDSGPLNKTLSTIGAPTWYYATNTIR